MGFTTCGFHIIMHHSFYFIQEKRQVRVIYVGLLDYYDGKLCRQLDHCNKTSDYFYKLMEDIFSA